MEMTIPVTDAANESRSLPAADDRPIWEIVVELGEQVPEQVRDQIPHDGSIYYKHYLYGTAREEV